MSTPAPMPGMPLPPDARPRIVVVIGLPGSGKSTYLEQRRLPTLSSDAIRKLLADDETDQTIHGRVFSTLRHLLYQRIAIRRPVTYLDATHLTPQERRPYIQMARLFNCAVEALYFDVPLEVCKQRNRRRWRVVPEEALERMAAKLVPPSLEEGFEAITVVHE